MLIAIPPWKNNFLSLQYYNWLLSSLSLCMVILRRTTRDLSDCEIIGDSYDGELIVGFCLTDFTKRPVRLSRLYIVSTGPLHLPQYKESSPNQGVPSHELMNYPHNYQINQSIPPLFSPGKQSYT